MGIKISCPCTKDKEDIFIFTPQKENINSDFTPQKEKINSDMDLEELVELACNELKSFCKIKNSRKVGDGKLYQELHSRYKFLYYIILISEREKLFKELCLNLIIECLESSEKDEMKKEANDILSGSQGKSYPITSEDYLKYANIMDKIQRESDKKVK